MGLPLHASHVAYRVLSSILGENAGAATIWWPFLETLTPLILNLWARLAVAIQLCRHKLLPFVLNGYSFTCADTILRPCDSSVFWQLVQLCRHQLVAVPEMQERRCAQVVKSGCAVVKMVKAVKNGQI